MMLMLKATCSALLVVVDESQILPRDESPPETPLKRAAPPIPAFGPPPVVQPTRQVRDRSSMSSNQSVNLSKQ